MPHTRKPSRSDRSFVPRAWRWTCGVLAGAARLFTPGARGVYPPHSNSLIVLGVMLPRGTDKDALSSRLWWRGLGIIERDRHLIAGADITVAVHKRRVRQARQFVIKQLRNAGVRGVVTRWDHVSLGNKEHGTRDKKQATGNRKQATRIGKQAPKRTRSKQPPTSNNDRQHNPQSKTHNPK